ncbi:MAG: DsbA family protein [Pelagibacterales bacterium]|nr:DsbA family protein [Pelagibacterales bacterium]
MSFLNKSGFGDKPSLVKPIIVVAVVFLIVGGIYSFFGKKTEDSKDSKDASKEEAMEIKPSGLDPDMDVDTVADVEKVLEKWIEANPQAILASVANMQKKAMEDQAKNAQKNIGDKKAELFDNPNSPVFAPEGYDVTIVEFFDYSCGYCKKAQTTVENLLKKDTKIRIIYKDYPILGQASMDIAQVSVAVSLVAKDSYKKFHDALMKTNSRSKEEAIKVAAKVGIDAKKVESALTSEKEKITKILQENAELGLAIGINGTPGFIVGEELIPGAIDLSSFEAKVAALRQK